MAGFCRDDHKCVKVLGTYIYIYIHMQENKAQYKRFMSQLNRMIQSYEINKFAA